MLLTEFLLGVAVVVSAPRQQPAAPPSPVPASPVAADHRHVTLISLGGAATDPLLRRVDTEIGGAARAVDAFWGTDWPPEIVVVATATDAQFAQQAAGVADTAHIAAVTVADDWDGSGRRIVFAPGAATMTPAALRIVLTHELFHYATRAQTAPDAPRWLTEGVADYVARPTDGAPGPAQPLPQALPSDGDFAADEPQLSAAYDRAWWFARFVADRYGAPALRALYVRAAGPDHAGVAAAFREVLGADDAELLAGWREWLTRNGLA